MWLARSPDEAATQDAVWHGVADHVSQEQPFKKMEVKLGISSGFI